MTYTVPVSKCQGMCPLPAGKINKMDLAVHLTGGVLAKLGLQ